MQKRDLVKVRSPYQHILFRIRYTIYLLYTDNCERPSIQKLPSYLDSSIKKGCFLKVFYTKKVFKKSTKNPF